MRFKKIYIEITNQCNLKCSFCVQNSRTPKFISIEEFEHILLQIKPYTKYIYLHVLGEPLLHPNLKDLLFLANKHEFYVNITTNGTLLQKNKELLLNSNIRQINISLHSFPEQEDYLKNVIHIGDECSKQNIYISYRLWTIEDKLTNNMKSTLDYIQNHYNKEIKEYKNSIKLKKHCFISFDTTFEWPTLSQPYINDSGTCYGWRNMCGILVDGTVVPCCLDSKGHAKLGNIYEESFESILNKNTYLLEEMKNHQFSLELCQKCSYRTRFD